MKHTEKLIAVTTFTLLAHYFVLNFFKVEGTEHFIGKVEKIESIEKGILPRVKVNFSVQEEVGDNIKIVTKSISLIKEDLNKIKIGKSYNVKTHKNWLITRR